MNYTRVSVNTFRNNMAEYMNMARYGEQVVVIEKWGKAPLKLAPLVEEKPKIDEVSERRKVLQEVAGMWKNRKDMQDSVAWVQKTRKKMSNRYNHDQIFG